MTKEAIDLPPLLPPQIVARPVTPQDLDRIVDEKEKEALIFWALQKMGKYRAAYLEQARRNFSTMFQLELAGVDWLSLPANKRTLDAMVEIVQRIPFGIPLNLKPKRGLANPFGILDIKKEYDAVLNRVKEWKRKRGTPRDRTFALMKVLPGLNWDLAWTLRKKKASEIAYNYLAMRYDLHSGETMKKQLSLARQPVKLARRILEEITREVGMGKLVKSPKMAKS